MKFDAEASQFPDSSRFSYFNRNQVIRPIPTFQFKEIKKENFSLDGSKKGLRILSKKVKSIIEENPVTTYKEVAEKLLQGNGIQKKDEQNIRRRVYDALNVLIAAGVMERQGKHLKATEETVKTGKCLHKEKWKYVKDQQAIMKSKQQTLKLKQQYLMVLMKKNLKIATIYYRNCTIPRSLQSSQEPENQYLRKEDEPIPFQFSQQSANSYNYPIVVNENRFYFPFVTFWARKEDLVIENYNNLIVKINSKNRIDLVWDADFLTQTDQTFMSKIFKKDFIKYMDNFQF